MFVILRSRLEPTSHPRSSSSKLPPSLQSAPLRTGRKHGSVKSLEKTGKNTFFSLPSFSNVRTALIMCQEGVCVFVMVC